MVIAVVILTIIVILFGMYIAFLQLQLHCINKQLKKRLEENTRETITLQLFNKKLNTLAININKCLKAEEALRLNSVGEEKGFKELIANISHDLRTPLTAIKGYQQLMEKDELTDSQRYKLNIAQRYAEELGNLIEHFFEYSYLINVEPVVNLEPINITNLVTECLVAVVSIIEEKKMIIHFEETPSIFVLGDREMVTRIIQNLIRNCIQHSTGDIYVVLCATDKVGISFKNLVKDNYGIDAEKLFQRFYTGDKARRHSTGLGLAIVKILAEKMDGEVGSEVKEGMLDIWVKFPLYR